MVDQLAAVTESAAVVRGNVPIARRVQMLREIIRRQDALTRHEWELPPMTDSEHYSVYDEMRADPTITYAVDLLTEAILSEPYHVETVPEGATDRGALAVAEWLRMNLADLDIESALETALNALWRGFWVHEITWRLVGGRYALSTLAEVQHDQIALERDDKLRVTAILSRPYGSVEPQRLPVEKCWFHTHKATRHNPAGQSMLDNAYRPWRSKDQLLRFWGLALQRFGMPFFIVTVPTNASDGFLEDVLDKLQQLRLDGIALLPESVGVTVHNPVQWANLAFEVAISYQESEINKRFLLQSAPSGSATGRTYVTGDGQEELRRGLAYRLKRISRHLSTSFREQIIRPLVQANWGNAPHLVPQLILPVPDPTRLAMLAAPLAQMRTAGIIDAPVAAELLGLPEPTDEAPAQAKPGDEQPTA